MAFSSFYILFLCFIISSAQIEKEKPFTSFNEEYENPILSQELDIFETLMSMLENIKNDTNSFILWVNFGKDIWKYSARNQMVNNASMKFLVPLIDDIFFNESNTFINDTNDIINHENGTILLEDLIEFLNDFKTLNNRQINLTRIFLFYEKIINFPGVDKLFNYFFFHDEETFLISELLFKKMRLKYFFASLRDVFWEHRKVLQHLFVDAFRVYSNDNEFKNVISNFIKQNNKTFLNDLKNKFQNETVINGVMSIFKFNDNLGRQIFEALIKQPEVINIFFGLIHEDEIVFILIDIFKHIQDTKYILEMLPNSIKRIYRIDDHAVGLCLNYSLGVIKRLSNENSFIDFITGDVVKLTSNYFKNETIAHNISYDCAILIYNTYFSNRTDLSRFKFYYLEKLLLHSTRDKNDFLTYEGCLKSKHFTETEDFNFTVKPIYVIGMINDKVNRAKFNSSILSQKYNYVISYCFPYGTYNNPGENKSSEMCSQDDYNKIIHLILELSFNMETSSINSIDIKDERFRTNDYLKCFITMLFMIIPLLIRGFLALYKKIRIKKSNKIRIINNRLNSGGQINDDILSITNNKLLEEHKNSKNFIEPKWYRYLNEYFSLIKNAKELFNFEMNKTKYNNLNGLTYIKGLQGLSMIFYVFGQTFLVLFNIPSKAFLQYDFYKSMKSILYCIPFVGLRYSPRIIFSCSGYTLIFKFLCFIDQDYDWYFLKFILLQSYRYILLILSALFLRYSLYYIDIFFSIKKRPISELFKYNIQQNQKNFFKYFFLFFVGIFEDEDERKIIKFIHYLYIPLNEVFFFIFGTILISLGKQFKLRIDYIIIGLILLIYSIKILFFVLYLYKKHIYSTLYFYSIDYGAFILSPLYNLPSFLIGMYFGLINYSVQRGIEIYRAKDSRGHSTVDLLDMIINNDEINKLNKNKDEIKQNLSTIEKTNKKFHMNNDKQKDKSINYNSYVEKIKLNDKMEESNIKKNEKRSSNKESNSDTFSNIKLNKSVMPKKIKYSKKIKQMPFLIGPTNIFHFHKKNNNRLYFKMMILFCLMLLLFCIVFRYFIIYKYSDDDYLTKLSLEKVITNYPLNILYLLDIELFVFMINWILFCFYSKAQKIADIFNFLNNIHWGFFIKSYFSFILVSNIIIVYNFYQSETVVKINLSNIYIYSFINLFFILIFTIIIYSCFEFPLKKIFKTFNNKAYIIDNNYLEEEEEENEGEEMEMKAESF